MTCGVQADNPGLWFYHCHILWHQVIGQGLVFAEGVQHISPPPSDLPVCDQKCNNDIGGLWDDCNIVEHLQYSYKSVASASASVQPLSVQEHYLHIRVSKGFPDGF